ncbi:MAG: PLP-dependent aspartate aminotransferase family protein [Micrococcales bacterium]|nr:PLP-dependent aspartate aminotransferase family protein [Micrococcales bacterium]
MSHNPPNQQALSPETIAVTAGRPSWTQGAPVNPLVVLSSTFISRGDPKPDDLNYARTDSPNYGPVQEAVGLLERSSRPATVFASGMAAIDAALALVPVGGRVVMPNHCYSVARALAKDLAAQDRIRLSLVPIANTKAVKAALAGGDNSSPAAMLYLETPTNPLLEIAEGPALIEAAHEVGALVVADNTLATPLGQRPLEWGADLVVHSMTKYLCGHSDMLMGAVVTDSKDHSRAIRRHRQLRGAVPGAWDCFLAVRGLRTLPLRMQRINESAATLARRLVSHPLVETVRHPSLPQEPGHEVAKAQMQAYGGLISVEVRGGQEAADLVTQHVRLWAPATSLGGVESTLERRARYPGESPDIPQNLLRLSVGIENVDDLWEDLSLALNRTSG